MADKGGGRWDVGRDWTADEDLGWLRPADRGRDRAHPPEVPAPADPAPPAGPAGWPEAGRTAPVGDPRSASRRGPQPGGRQPVAGPQPGGTYQPGQGQRSAPAYQRYAVDPTAAGYQPGPGRPTGSPNPPGGGPRSAPAYQRYGADRGAAADRAPAPYETYLDDQVQETDRAPAAAVIRPTRVLLLIALLVSAGLVVYGFFIDRSGLQVPISVVGLAMLGVSFLLTALASLVGGIRVARQGSRIASAGLAFFGGLCALGAAGSLASALVLGLLYGQRPG